MQAFPFLAEEVNLPVFPECERLSEEKRGNFRRICDLFHNPYPCFLALATGWLHRLRLLCTGRSALEGSSLVRHRSSRWSRRGDKGLLRAQGKARGGAQGV